MKNVRLRAGFDGGEVQFALSLRLTYKLLSNIPIEVWSVGYVFGGTGSGKKKKKSIKSFNLTL